MKSVIAIASWFAVTALAVLSVTVVGTVTYVTIYGIFMNSIEWSHIVWVAFSLGLFSFLISVFFHSFTKQLVLNILPFFP